MTRVALIAHDEKKAALIEFAQAHETHLREYEPIATGTTGKRLMEEPTSRSIGSSRGRSAAT